MKICGEGKGGTIVDEVEQKMKEGIGFVEQIEEMAIIGHYCLKENLL